MVVKEALVGFGPLALAQWRVLGTAVIYLAYFLASGRVRRLRLSPRGWLLMAATSLCGVTLNQLFIIDGLALSSVGHTGLIVALGPVMVLVIAVLVRMESLTTWKMAGMLVSFGGVGMLAVDKTAGGNGTHWRGDLLLLAGTTVFAVYVVLMKDLANRCDPLTLNTLIFVLGAMMLAPFCARALAATPWSRLRLEAWWELVFMVVFGSVLPYSLFAYALTGLAASRVAAFNYLQPVIASSLAIWLLSERLTAHVLIGGTLVLAGVYLIERERGNEIPMERKENENHGNQTFALHDADR